MKIYPNQKYNCVCSVWRQNELKLHSYLSSRFPQQVYDELEKEGFETKDLSLYWIPVDRK